MRQPVSDGQRPWLILALGLVVAAQAVSVSVGQDAAEGDREKVVMERFLALLEKARGRAGIDRVYGYHVERGTLDAFIKTYRGPGRGDPNDGAAWLLLGLLESQRGPGRRGGRRPSARPRRPGPTTRCRLLPGPGAGPGRPARRGGRRRSSGALARKPAAGRPAGDLPGAGPGPSAGPPQRPGAGRLGPAGEALPRRPAGPGADRRGPGRGGGRPRRPCRGTRPWRRPPRPVPPGPVRHRGRRPEGPARPHGRGPGRLRGAARRARARELALSRGPPQDRGRLPPQRRPGRPGRLLREVDQEEPRGRRGDGPARPDAWPRRAGPPRPAPGSRRRSSSPRRAGSCGWP